MATIVTKNSSTASAVPTTSDLVQGELAVNVTDKRIFTENASTQIVELGTNPSSITTATATVTGTLTANGTFASSNAVLTGGTVNGIVIGGSTPQAITGTTVTASTGFVGGLTGNVTGNLTGNVTGNVNGNVTGDLTGNVTASSGTTTLNNLVVNGTADFTNTKLVNITTPTAGTDAANKTYVDDTVAAVIDSAPAALDTLNELAAALGDDANFAGTVTTALATKLPLAGGTMTGAIAMGTAKITGLGDPTSAQDAATKTYVDTADALKLSLSGGTMSGAIAMGTNKITGVGNPTLAQDAATKDYVDDILGSATSAATSAAAAATSASNASTSASNAASSATTASNAVTSAELAATNAAASYDSFDDRYLGAKASDPTLDNDGDALIAGATYFNTSTNSMKVYSGSAWSNVAPVATTVTLSQVTDFPSQSGQSGKYLSTNGTVPTWETLTTDPTLGTLTKTFTSGESSTINLTSSVLAPVVSVTKEVPQSGVTNNNWDVNSTTENYTRLNSAYATTLDWVLQGLDSATASGTYNFSSITSYPEDITLSYDGTKMYIIDGGVSDTVYQFTLATAYDVTTASYASKSFSVAAQENGPRAVRFSSDGTKMYIVGDAQNTVFQYTLSTAWDVSTASYASKSFSTASQSGDVLGLFFSTDGTKFYTSTYGGSVAIYQYNMSTAWDVSTASYSSNSFTVSQDIYPHAVVFNSAGTKMYIAGDSTDKIYQYTLSTAWDVSTVSYDSISLNSIALIFGLAIGNDQYIYEISNTLETVRRYTIPQPLQLGTGSFASADVGKTIEANDGVFVLTATDGSYVETTAPTSYDQVASGSWEMYGVVYNAADGDLELSGIDTTFDISTASFVDSFSVGGQDAAPSGIAFNTDGTKMFISGVVNAAVFEYTLSTGFDVSTASYVDSFSVSAQETSPWGLAFSTDGTKMFITGSSGDDVNEYTLSTAFDVSTSSFVDTFSVSAQETTPRGLTFNSTGTKMFVVGPTSDSVHTYNLISGFDVSTASFVESFSVSGQDSSPVGIAFNNSGVKMFILGNNGQDVNYYNLSIGFDVSTASFVESFSVASQDGNPLGIAFNNNGTKMFISGSDGDDINEYSLTGVSYFTTGYQPVHTTSSIDSTYWTDINSMTADQAAGEGNVYYAISTDDRTTWTVIDNTDGERDIVRNNAGTWQYNSNGTYASETWVNGATNTELATLAEAMEGAVDGNYNVSSLSYDSVSFSANSQESFTQAIVFKDDGTKLYVTGSASDTVYQYTLTTAFDLSTASYDSVSFSVSAQDTFPRGLAFSSDGSKMYMAGITNDSVYQYSLSTNWDLSTASYDSVSFSVSGQDLTLGELKFNSIGTKMYIIGDTNDSVFQYTLSSAWDLSTASYDSVSFSVASQENTPTALLFSADGSKMFICGNQNNTIYQYSLSVAYDISTSSYDSVSFNTTGTSLAFNSNGSKLYVASLNGVIYQYTVGGIIYPNQMDKTQLDAVTDPNHIALGNDLDLSIIFNMTSGTTVPSSDGVAINYDANVLNKGAVLGTDYDFDAPAGNAVRVTALAANNLKVRVV